MFLIKLLQPSLFFNLIKMFFSSGNPIKLLLTGLFNKENIISLKIDHAKYFFNLRTRGDVAIIFEMFFLKVYPFEMFGKNLDNGLDLGAHIGIPAIIMAKKNNFKKIYSLEPVKENFEILVKNIKLNNLDNIIIPLNTGIGSKDEILQINKSNSTNSHSIVMEEGGEKEDIEVISIQSLARKYSINNFDLIKMDIEGYEYNVIDSLLPFVKDSKIFTMERHEILGHDFDSEINQRVLSLGFEIKSLINPGPVYTYIKK
jgi:FkbM family methyltransferase